MKKLITFFLVASFFSFAWSAQALLAPSGGGLLSPSSASDLVCTDCIGATEIEDIYLLNTGDVLDTNGVSIDTDGDGMLILLGASAGFDEDLRFNFDDTSNEVTVTTTTAVANVNFSSIALQESGIAVLNNDEIDASSELLAIMDDEVGTGALTFATAPIFTTSIDIGSAGVRLSAATGILTFLGLGAGFDENLLLDLDGTTNTGVFTSSTSLATINFSSIALQESGIAVLNNDEIDASSELLAIMDDETGTGLLAFATSPTFTTSVILGAAGVSITDDGDGALTFLGIGDGVGDNDENLIFNFEDTANTIALSTGTGVTVVDFGTIAIDAASLTLDTALDISGDTNLTAGRSLTLTDDDVLADAELYTDTKCVWIENPTAADDFKSVYFFKTAATITSLWCESDQTTTMMGQIDDDTPADIDSVDMTCDSTPPEDTSLDGDVSAVSGNRLDLDIASVASTPTWVSFCFTMTLDD